MSFDLAKNTILGLSLGYSYGGFKNKEDEIKQGKNYYLSSCLIYPQLQELGILVSKINACYCNDLLCGPLKILCNRPIVGFIGILFCAAVNQGHYEQLASNYNHLANGYLPLPKKLSGRAVSLFCFFAEHTGDIIRVAMVASSLAIIILGHTVYGGAVLAAMAYQRMDQNGMIPRRISLFMEMYMPAISSMAMFTEGNLITRMFCIMQLASYTSASTTQIIHQQVDKFVRHYLKSLPGPSLKQIDTPLKEPKDLDLNGINDILDCHDWEFESKFTINPAHCSKNVVNFDKLPVDHNFEKFLFLFDKIDWESKYLLIVAKLKDDDRFIDFLFEKFPGEDKKNLAKNIDDFIQHLAKEDKTTSEKYAANWIRSQMKELISVLQGETRAKGQQQDVEESIDYCSKILPYLSSIKSPIEIEDMLLKLAVEGGGYCPRGVKRAGNEILSCAIQGGSMADTLRGDLIANYELKVSQALQNKRSQIMQNLYKVLMNKIKIPGVVADDTHGFDLYRLYLSLGFFPLTKFERNKMGFLELLVWETYAYIRAMMVKNYFAALDSTVHDEGENEFGLYVRQIINENDALCDDEKEALLEKFTERNNGEWTIEETQRKFHRLLLVKLGVLIAV